MSPVTVFVGSSTSFLPRIFSPLALLLLLLLFQSSILHHKESTTMFRRGARMMVPDFVTDAIDNNCCDCWKEGCGLNGCFGGCADVLEATTPLCEGLANYIWCFASPLAFPCIFLFSADPHTHETSGYDKSMIGMPCTKPLLCCATTLCMPCGQWYARRQALGGDLSKYRLWQGQHDGPHCCARRCPGAPITIRSGTYGEQNCPACFLCLEVSCLAGGWSVCCAYDVTRRLQRDERGLNLDPTEARQQECIQFFSRIMHHCFMLGCCVCVASCCVGLCAPDSEGAQECSGEARRASRACCRIAHIIWRGIIWTRAIGIGCGTAQIVHEASVPWDGNPKGKMAPKRNKMDRGVDEEDEDAGAGKEFADMAMPWEKEETNTDRRNRQSNRTG